MKTKSLLVLGIIIMHLSVIAQVKIGSNPTSINSASLLELETTNQGFVLPRVSIADVSASSPLASGLLTGTLVYNTNTSTTGGSGTGIYLWDGSKWVFISTGSAVSSSAWLLTGNSGLSSSANFIGTTDAIDFVARTANVERMRILGAANGSSKAGWIGMGVTIPRSSLDVTGHYTNKNVVTIENSSTSGYSSVDMLDSAGNLAGTFGYANLGTGGSFSGKDYFNGYGNDFLFTRGSSYDFIMKGTNGFIGLNTNVPSERLHVVGNIYLNGAFMPGGLAGTSGYILTSAGAGISPTWTNPSTLAWALTGNTGTSYATNFLGTTDNVSMRFRTNNAQRMIIDSLGRVGIGLSNPSYALSVLSASNPLYLSGVQSTSTFSNDSILTINAGVVKKTSYASLISVILTGGNPGWNLTGNSGTITGLNFIGTSDAADFVTKTNNAERMRITSSGLVGIGIANPSYALSVLSASNPLYLSGVQATSTLNTDSVLTIANGIVKKTPFSAIPAATTHTLTLSTNTLTSTVNGIAATSNAVSGVSNISSANTLSTVVNGVTGITVPIINTNTNALTQSGGLVTTVNGVAATTSIAGGTVSNVLGYNSSGAPVYQSLNNISLSSAWNLLGNSGTNYNTNFLGTTDNVSMRFRTNNIQRMIIDSLGKVGIGLSNPSYALSVLSSANPLYLSGVQATAALSTDSVLTISNGIVKKTPSASLTGISWLLTGNSGTNYATNFLGTTDNVSLRFRTNNTEQMIIDSLGSVGIGSSTFDPNNPAKLLVDYGTTTSNTIVNLKGSVDDYFQINIKNSSNGGSSSSDYVATADDGTDSTNYVDMGINGSNYAFSTDNWGGAHDAYLYSNSHDLYIGTQAANSAVVFLVGGGRAKTNAALRISGVTSNVIVGKGDGSDAPVGNILRGPNALGTNIAGGSLTLQGGSSTGTATGANININGGTSASGTAGNVIFNTAASERMRIDPSGNIGIGISNPSNKLSVLSSSNPLYLAGVQATSTFSSDSILTINAGVVKKAAYSSLSAAGNWSLTGNSGTIAGTNFIGTTDAVDFVTKTNNTERLRVTSAGLVGIGTNAPASDFTIYQSSGSGGSKGFTFTGNSIGGTNSGTGFLMSLGYNTSGNKQLWLGDADYAGNASGSFARFVQTGTVFPVFDAVSGDGALRRYLAFGVAGDANSGVIFGGDNTGVNPGSQVWDNGNMAIGNGYKLNAAPSNGLLVQGNIGVGITNPSYKLSVLAASNPLYLSGVLATSTFSTDSILTINAGVVKKAPYSSLPTASGGGWALTGNSISAGQFLGTTNALALILKSNSTQMANFDGNLSSLALGVGAVNSTSDHNVAIGYNASTNNQYALALGYNSAATGVRSVAIGNGASAATASGAEAVAIGFNATTSGNQAIALGYQATGSGQYGVALGYTAQATALQSTAIGYAALASAQYSNALGYQAQATGLQSTAIGYQAQTSQSNTILLGSASTANLYVGIGTATPTAKLHIVGGTTTNYPLQMTGLPTGTAGTDNILTINSSGVVGYITPAVINSSYWGLNGNAAASGNFLGTTNTTPLQFKFNSTSAGYLDANNTSFGTSAVSTSGTNNTAIGSSANAANGSTAIGASSVTTAANNTAVGNSATANNSTNETAIGASAQATAQYNTAVGYNAQAISNSQATAIGTTAKANAIAATALGYNAQAISNGQTTAIGTNSLASSQYNIAVGYNAQSVNNSFGTAVGTNSNTTGQYATAIGAASGATFQYSTALGYNAQAITNNQTTAVGANSSASGTGSTAIGYNAQTSQNNTLLLGDAANTSLNVGIGTAIPGNKLEIKQGTAGNSGLRFTNLTSSSAGSAATNSSDQVLTVNASGDVIMTNGLSYVNTQTGAYTLTAADNQAIVYITSGTAVTITIPNTLPQGFTCAVIQGGAGQLTFSGAGLQNAYSQFKTPNQYASITVQTPTSGTNVLSGQTSW